MSNFTDLKNNSIKGIIFDLDGTLYKMQWFFRPLITANLLSTCMRLPRFLKIRGTFSGIDMNSGDVLINAICEKVASVENCSKDEIRNWMNNQFYPAFIRILKFFRNSRPEINKTLSLIKKNGLKVGVLSDYDYVSDRLVALGIDTSLFDTMTSSESFGALKPAPRPLLEIASDWNVNSRNILMVGDRSDTDGIAAQSAGMHFLQITDSEQKKEFAKWDKIRSFLCSIKEG